jgi:hypothetical protein
MFAIAVQQAPVTVTELEKLLSCTRDTTLKYMKELAKTGVFQMAEGQAPNRPSSLQLSVAAAHLKWGM